MSGIFVRIFKINIGRYKIVCIISDEYTISLAPAIQHSCPVIDFVELTGVLQLPTLCIARASLASPAGTGSMCVYVIYFVYCSPASFNAIFKDFAGPLR